MSGAVVSFNGRSGVVTPEVGDYTKDMVTGLQDALDSKVDKVAGKQLGIEDYTSADKVKLAGVESGANAYMHPDNHPASIITQDST